MALRLRRVVRHRRFLKKRWKLSFVRWILDPSRGVARWIGRRRWVQSLVRVVADGSRAARARIEFTRRWKRNWFRTVLVLGGQLVLLAFVAFAVGSLISVLRGEPLPFVWEPVNTECTENNAQACGVLTGIFFTAFPVILATSFLVNRKLRRVRRRYLRRARRQPNELVQTAGNIAGDIVGRDDVCDIIQEDLRDPKRRRPHVVVGGVGTGKTAVLVQLTRQLARRGAVPVPIRLRDARDETIDFLEMARRRFCKEAERWLGSDTDAETVWRTLRQKGEIVILADGLEEALADTGWQRDRDHRVRAAVSEARARGYPLVIASRPHDALKALDAAHMNLEPLSEEAALSYIGAAATEADEHRIAHVIERADVVETPLYMQIARDLNAARLLENTRGSDRVELRWRLMETWTDALINGNLRATERVPLDRWQRERTVLQLAALACVGLARDSLQVSFADWERECQGPEVARLRNDLREALTEVEHLRLGSSEAAEDIARVEDELRHAARDLARLRAVASGNGDGRVRASGGSVATAEEPRPAPGDPAPPDDGAARDARPPNLAEALEAHLAELGRREDEEKERSGSGARAQLTKMQIAASDGVRIDLVEHIRDGVRFPHSIMQAYLGSLVIGWALRDDAFLKRALDNPGRELLVALIMYSRAIHADSGAAPWRPAIPPEEGERLRTTVVAALLQAIEHQTDPSKRLDLLSAVVEIESVAGPGEHRESLTEIANVVWRADRSDEVVRDSKHKLISRMGEAARRAQQRPEVAQELYRGLYDLAVDEELYTLRLAAAQELGRGGNAAFAALRTRLETTRLEGATDDEKLERGCVIQAWLLPMLVYTVDERAAAASVREILAGWLAQVGNDMPRTIEAALAQGFKHAANRRPGHGQETPYQRTGRAHLVQEATDMLPRARFWFSRMALVQALGLWTLTAEAVAAAAQPAAADGGARHDYRALVERWVHRPEYQETHPFVTEAARLVVDALRTKEPDRFMWIDESGVVSKVGSRARQRTPHARRELWIAPSTGWIALDRRAQQLVADVLITLNLAERGATAAARERRLNNISGDRLPYCIVEKRCEHLRPSRTVGMTDVPAPGSDCDESCPAGLCPYPPRGQQPFRVELSEAFCRNQQAVLKRRRRFGRPAGWQAAGRRELVRFWSQMERRARI
ncbi:MAG TPA: hypothetical protein VHF89_00610 [Solirubrobacteraceae bacterium]|nr:hypothetical protein [Solirubrobacteraceae bacterium]